MAQELVLIFDDLGNLYEIENITEMLTERLNSKTQ